MKKLILKCTGMVVVFVGVSQFMLYSMTGKTPLDSLKVDNFQAPSLPSSLPNIGQKETVYKWVDENGVTQYSSEPPPDQTQAQTLELDPNVNIIQSVKPQEEKSEKVKNITSLEAPSYSPDRIQKLMEDAQNVQKKLNDRYAQQEDALKNM